MLKKLELHGFKSFAGKTQFLFSDGITAVVGPNGAGKSNLADSMRWVLGEQRPVALRAKRSEDMIFSGTEKRARMGMAQGFITIDNSTGILPIDYSEVVIGRRIYRTGESEYLINGSKVRLRDVQELLAHAGVGTSTYTVIGQGLIDAALSLRAEERRQLFEDAAGLGAYQGKRDESLRRLGQTHEHLTRVRDILTELEPQVKRLRRQAERAEEYRELSDALHDLLRQFYGYRWGQGAQALTEAQQSLSEGRSHLNAASQAVAEVAQRLEQVRQRQNNLREELNRSRQARARLREEAEQLRRERAVAAERERGVLRQQEALQQEVGALEAEESALRAQLAAHESEGEALQQARAQAQTSLDRAKQQLAEAEAARGAIRRTLEEARRVLGKLSARQAELRQRQGALGERRREAEKERAGHDRALAELGERLAQRVVEVGLLEEQLSAIQKQQATLAQERQRLLAERQQAAEGERSARQSLHEVQRRLTDLNARREVLARLRAEGAGYEAGVRALLAARGRFGESVLGPVAELVRVPEAVAPAISAALGEGVQAVVLRDEGEAIRRWLHESKVGRVQLLPLPHLHEPEAVRLPVAEGIVGRGADLVQANDPALLEYLLGDWLVVESWAVGATLERAAGWNVVTLDGQVRERRGALRAGSGTGQGSALLAQSREWAELPDRLAIVEAEQSRAQAALGAATGALERIETGLQRQEREIAESGRQAQRAETALERERRDAEKLQQEQAWRGGLVEKLAHDLEGLAAQAATLGTELTSLQEERGQVEARIAASEREWEAAHPGTLRETVERARTQVAVTEEQVASWRRERSTLDEALARLAQRQQAKSQQRAQLEQEAQGLTARTAELEATAQHAEASLNQALEETRPLEQEQDQNEGRLAEWEEEHQALRRRRQEREEQVHTAQLALQAAEERLAHLREQIESDLGMVEIEEEGAALAHQSLLPIEELVTSLPKVVTMPEGLENDVRRLRRRIGYLGAVNPSAPTEYAEVYERFTFLSEQSDDLTRASADLRKIVAELDTIMRARFVSTFAAIDEAFQGHFTRLFNGGQARLELTEPDDPMASGIDIVARPPGKRSQSISLLSGGERALTAAGLIFAILKVSPAPFCVLDEVDAMLDEANVGRFRDMLAELAQETQFIVVTHNRGTIEAASAIYGISQSDPGISEVISLHLDEAIRAAKQ